MAGPLSGLTIIDVTTFLAGPLATQMLGDLGATIIKVESPPTGDTMRAIGPNRNPGMPSQYLTYNRNKHSVAIDLKSPEGKEALLRLVKDADIFVHNMRPPAAARLGIDYASLAKVNERLVYASAPGFSQDGPYKDRPAYDDLIQGMSGVSGMFLRRDGKPAYAPFNLADKLTAYCLVSGVGMAMVHRERTGEGQEVQVPMLETLMEFNSSDQMYGYVFDPVMAPGYGHPRALSPLRAPFETADGYICMQTTTNRQFSRLFDLLDLSHLMSDDRFSSVAMRTRNLAELLPMIAERLLTKSASEWGVLLDEADIPNAPMLTLEDLDTHPYLQETGFYQTYEHPTEGRLRMATPAMRFSKSPQEVQCAPPTFGQHTDDILGKLGYSQAEIEKISGKVGAD